MVTFAATAKVLRWPIMWGFMQTFSVRDMVADLVKGWIRERFERVELTAFTGPAALPYPTVARVVPANDTEPAARFARVNRY